MDKKLSLKDRGRAVLKAANHRPKLSLGVALISAFAAFFEGIGLSFILPIVELAQGDVDPAEADGLLGVFVGVYTAVGVPFTLGTLVAGVAVVMTVRYTSSFFVGWFRGAIETYYTQHLQEQAFTHAMDARTSYFDTEGSDEIMNAIVTQSEYAGRSLRRIIRFMELLLLSFVYFLVALVFAPVLTLVTVVVFGSITLVFRHILASGYSIGERVADANESIQEYAQAGVQGIRDVKLFGLEDELVDDFRQNVSKFTTARIHYFRNKSAIQNFYQLLVAVAIFVLIFVAITVSSLSLGSLGVFLFAMFRLGPRLSTLNDLAYNVDADLPHLVRTQEFIADLKSNAEDGEGPRPVPDQIVNVEFDDVTFSYATDDETVLRDISFAVERGEFIAFVGPSGAGKSSIVSLIARLYDPDDGQIRANEIPIADFSISEWRSKTSVVRQDPHIFNDTLRANVTVGNRSATQQEIEEACELARVTEFLDDLPQGYDTHLGDDGVRLSGGQRQRVAIARALLKRSDLLVLDEATSDLDTSLEEEVHEGIESLDRDYTMIVIAHRLSTVTNADRIYTLESGRITEVGSHSQLVEGGGTYAELYEMQAQ